MEQLLLPQPKIILEGTSLTSKTDIAFQLAEHDRIILGNRRHRWHIPLVSSEWETKSDAHPTKASPGHSMITFEPKDEAWALECFHTYLRLFELQRDYYWIVDRFHLSAMSHQATHHGRRYDLSWVDERLAALNFCLVLCVRAPETFEAARAERLVYSENPQRYVDLDKIIAQQESYRELAKASVLPVFELDVTTHTLESAAEAIIDWVEDAGCFYRKGHAR